MWVSHVIKLSWQVPCWGACTPTNEQQMSHDHGYSPWNLFIAVFLPVSLQPISWPLTLQFSSPITAVPCCCRPVFSIKKFDGILLHFVLSSLAFCWAFFLWDFLSEFVFGSHCQIYLLPAQPTNLLTHMNITRSLFLYSLYTSLLYCFLDAINFYWSRYSPKYFSYKETDYLCKHINSLR
jgi:hypothetical protein